MKTASDDDMEMGMLPPTCEPSPPQKPKDIKSAGVKRSLENAEEPPSAKKAKTDEVPSLTMQNFLQNFNMYDVLLHAFQYLNVQELLRASRVCHMWRDLALHKSLWKTVRMKNSHVKDWDGFSATLRRNGTRHLDLRKMLKQDLLKAKSSDCIKALSKVNTLVRLDLCRCTSNMVEQVTGVCPQLEYVAACIIKSTQIDLMNVVGKCLNLTEVKLKSQNGMEVSNVDALANLTKLKSLSLKSVKNVNQVLEVVGKLSQLEALELGELMVVDKDIVTKSFSQLTKLKRLRLEKGQECPTDAILTTLSRLPSLVQLELINFDVKVGFQEALSLCSNIKILLIIPTYETQSATTNHLVIEGVSKLSKTLNHFVWGLTRELLRVTDQFIDQWEMGQKNTGAKSPNQAQKTKTTGDCIPILKPAINEGGVTQVDVLQLPKLHKVLTALLPNTKIIILKVPFSVTWRQTISNWIQ